MVKAVIFDFDGIIVDSEPLHYKAFQQILEPLSCGYSWEEYVDRYMGFDDRDAFREAFRSAGKSLDDGELERLIAEKADAFQAVIAGGVTPYPGVVELIRGLSAKVPIAVCSGALPSDIMPVLDQFNLKDMFSVIVTAVDVAASKPDPASYRLATELLQKKYPDHDLAASSCIAIEDTPAGIASATGAGLRVVAVTNSYDSSHLQAASFIVDSLADVSVDQLLSL